MKKILAIGLVLATHSASANTEPPRALAPEQDSGVYLALRQAFYNSDDARVREYINIQLEADPENPVLLEEAIISSIYYLDIDLALQYATKLKEQKPDSIAVEVAEFTKLIQDGKFGDARSYTDQAKTLNFINPEILEAWQMALDGDPAQATAFLERTAEEQGELGFIFDYQRAMIEANIDQDYQKAADIIANKSRPIYLSDLDYYSHLALLKMANSPAFDVVMKEGYGEESTWPGFIVELIKSTERGEIDPSLDFATPQNAIGSYINALMNSGEGLNLDYGVERLLRGIAPTLASDNAWFLRQYMNYFYARGEYDDVVYFNQLTSPDSFLFQPNQNMSINALFELDRKNEAKELMEKISPVHPDEYAFKADVLRRLEDFEKASENYEKALEITGKEVKRMVWAIYGLAISYERLDMWDKAEPNFLKAIELEPENAEMLNYLGYSYVDRGENLEEGLKMIEKAVELQPNQGYIIDSLGWAYYRLGRYDDALAPLENASSLESTDPTINAHLGDLYWKLGRKREAVYQWERASRFLEKDTKDLSQAELKARLEKGI